MPDKKRIGVFGGTFSPIHIGHLRLAEEAFARMQLEKVLFMPAYIQPFKRDEKYMATDDRLNMIKLAIADNPHLGVTTIELDRKGISYTISSLREIKKTLDADTDIYFIVGTDMFLMIEKWYLASELLSEFNIIVGIRPGDDLDSVEALISDLSVKYGTDIKLIDNPPIEVSSTEIRAKMESGEAVDSLMPPIVKMYLDVKAKESESRFEHTKRVMDLATVMAEKNDVDVRKAMIAALWHDYEKDANGGVENNLNHGKLAAQVAKEKFGINDQDILNAIRYHTTGRAGMSDLELIIFLADTLEPGRKYKSIGKLRNTCLDDLRKGALMVLIELKEYLLQNGFVVTEDTEAAIADLEKGGNIG